MKISKWILALALLGGANMLSADSCGSCGSCPSFNPCDPCDTCGEMSYTVYGDLLWWDVRRTDLNYSGKTHTKYLNPDYDYGYRVGAVLYCDCWDFGVRYSSYDNSESKSGYSGEVQYTYKYDIDYDVLDFELGYNCCFNCKDLSFRPYLGLKFAWIDEEYKEDKKGSSDYNEYTHDMDAWGLYFGVESRWAFCDSIAFVARGSFGIMDAEIDNDSKSKTASGVSHTKRDKEDIYVNYDNIFVGFDISLCDWFCYDSNILVGWEMENWKSVKQFDTDYSIANLGLGGLVARFSLSF